MPVTLLACTLAMVNGYGPGNAKLPPRQNPGPSKEVKRRRKAEKAARRRNRG